MLNEEIEHFLTYCKVLDFSGKSIETFTISFLGDARAEIA